MAVLRTDQGGKPETIMDLYTVSITLPRGGSGNHAFEPDSAPPSSSIQDAFADQGPSRLSVDEKAFLPQSSRSSLPQLPSQGQEQRDQPAQQETQQQQPQQAQDLQQGQSSHSHNPFGHRLGSVRSRFPPSVKAFMPIAFGGKRASERIAEGPTDESQDDLRSEAVGGTASLDRYVRGAPSDWRKSSRLRSTSSLPLSVPEEGPPNARPADEPSSNIRDSRSTAGTRSSLDFSTFSADSTTPSTAAYTAFREGGSRHGPSKSDPPSATHSANNSITHLGSQHPLTSADLADAAHNLTREVMSSTQCIVSCSPVQEDSKSTLGQPSTTLSHTGQSAMYPPYPGQLQHPSYPPNQPYQHYAHGFGQEAGGSAGFGSSASFAQPFPTMPTRIPSGLGNPAAASSASLASSISHQPLHLPTQSEQKARMPRYNFNITGTLQQVMDARGAVLRQHPFRSRVSVKVPRADVLENATSSSPTLGSDAIKPKLRMRLDEIATSTDTHIAVMNKEARGADLGYGLETERNIDLVISGQLEGVEYARIRTLVLFDEQNGLTSSTIEINQKFHNIIGGRKRAVIQKIQEQTTTSIYFPLPLASAIAQHTPNDPTLGKRQNTIHITGDFFGVQRAREMLYQVFAHKSKCTISRETALLPRKMDWMLSERLEDLRQIMIDNGTFIDLPPLGTQSTRVSVYGDNRVNIERSIRTMMALACQFYVAYLGLFPVHQRQDVLKPASVTPLLQRVANHSGAEVVFRFHDQTFEIHGMETEAKSAVAMILDFDVVKQFNFQLMFHIELANSEREFLQGRKSGKLNKIQKQCGANTKFHSFNDYNFVIELTCSSDRSTALQGLALLQEELPAEVSFHVPEIYHKRCIGVGGKQIQKVMKRYGVYVKFSNAEEFAALGGYLDNEDNVIARTPAKNAINLENLKQSVMEMVNAKDKDYTTETVTISRRYHRSLLGEKGIFIQDIENKCSSKIIFPPRETCSDFVSIFGPESQIHIASAMLLEHVPLEAEFRTPSAPNLQQVVGSQEFVALTERVKRDLSISITVATVPSGANEAVFKLLLSRSNVDFLPGAKDFLEDFLVSRNINVYAAPARARSDSFASSFPHFATKLISTPATEMSDAQYQQELANRFNDGGRLRAAASSPALKALFDSPAATGAGPSHQSQAFGPSSSAASGAGASPLVGSSLYSSPYGDTMPGGVSSNVWGSNPRQVTTSAATAPVTGPSGIAFPQHNARQSEDIGMFNRGQDAFGLDDRMRQLRKPRSLAYRAQSLDMSNIGAQQAALEATAYGGPPGSGGGYGGFRQAGGSSGPGTPFAAYGGSGYVYGSGGNGGGNNYGWGSSSGFGPSNSPTASFSSGGVFSSGSGGHPGGPGGSTPATAGFPHHSTSQSTGGGHFSTPAISRMGHSSSSSLGLPTLNQFPSMPPHQHHQQQQQPGAAFRNQQQQQHGPGGGTPSGDEMTRMLGSMSFNPTQ